MQRFVQIESNEALARPQRRVNASSTPQSASPSAAFRSAGPIRLRPAGPGSSAGPIPPSQTASDRPVRPCRAKKSETNSPVRPSWLRKSVPFCPVLPPGQPILPQTALIRRCLRIISLISAPIPDLCPPKERRGRRFSLFSSHPSPPSPLRGTPFFKS
jgi:hypothetical protein